eukprot:TRINITY_DN1268_c0_g1_i1.p2 TRINITY_DN1268_c0_g1~~TRINITY_DN1268_c0_g1_i1.p2  ORF type:complete len:106 (-),score=23.34 TRINITY_DN1268_c0_g1_i1:95-370(-)
MSLRNQDLGTTQVKQLGEWWTHNSAGLGQFMRARLGASLKKQNHSLRGFAGFLMTCATIGFWVQLPFHDAVEGLAPPKKWAPKDGHGHEHH